MDFEEFRKNAEKTAKAVQRELFSKETVDKKYDALTAKMREWLDEYRKKQFIVKEKGRRANAEKKGITAEPEKKEQKEVEILWGPVYYQLPGKYHSVGASERVPIYFGSDGKWRVNGEETLEDSALRLIADDEEIEDYNKIMEDIRKIKEKIKT